MAKIKVPAAGVFVTFTVCIACFPGVATSMTSKVRVCGGAKRRAEKARILDIDVRGGEERSDYAADSTTVSNVKNMRSSQELGDWYPVLAVLCYNTADLVGKSLPGFWQPFNGTTVIIPVLLNVFVLPIMILEKHFDGSEQGGAVVLALQSTAVRFATISLLGVLTGFSATCCLMVAPSLAPKKYTEVAAQMMR